MTQPIPPVPPRVDFNDEDSNTSNNPTFDAILQARMSRRGLLRGGVASAAGVVFSGLGLAGCGSSDASPAVSANPAPGGSGTTPPANPPASAPVAPRLLGFQAVPKSLADTVTVPPGYRATILYALGDPLTAATPAYRNDGTDGDFANRAGDHHDGMEWFGLSADDRPSTTATARGLLAINHEATTDEALSSFFLHADGGTSTLPRPAAEIDKELAIHGVSIVEVRQVDGRWSYRQDSPFNRRVTLLTEIEIAGPARGHPLLVTRYSPDATRTRGTLNNCGTGRTPWGTLLTGEENWAGYFFRAVGDDAARGNDKSVAALRRYGRPEGAASRHGWDSGGTDDRFARWKIGRTGSSADGSDDYRNEINTMGYLVEIDPYATSSVPRKRTGLGRFAHENASFGRLVDGQPLAVYMGCDARNEYLYKFVSTTPWASADASATDRLAIGDKYLNDGRLYVARFDADGTGEWVELTTANPAISGFAAYPFADQAEICIQTRLAADAVGATKMDRPEWGNVDPATGEFYLTLTNNSNRRVDPTGSSQLAPDSANPRVYTDVKGTTNQVGNPNGHILRMREGEAGNTATRFAWDVYLFAAQSDAPTDRVNLSRLSADQDLSSPDGLVFTPSTGLCWIQTDDGAYTDVTNCMMLAAMPGRVGDGGKLSLAYPKADGSTLAVDTWVGKAPTPDTLKRFLVGPSACEITGLCETPDGKALFVNIQHPGETTRQADIADPTKYTSRWPANAGYGAGQRPRSATIVITREDGGQVGY